MCLAKNVGLTSYFEHLVWSCVLVWLYILMIPIIVLFCQVPVNYTLLELVLWDSYHTLIKYIVHHLNAALLLNHSVEVLLAWDLDKKQNFFRNQFAVDIHLVLLEFILPWLYFKVSYLFEDFIQLVLETVVHCLYQFVLVNLLLLFAQLGYFECLDCKLSRVLKKSMNVEVLVIVLSFSEGCLIIGFLPGLFIQNLLLSRVLIKHELRLNKGFLQFRILLWYIPLPITIENMQLLADVLF